MSQRNKPTPGRQEKPREVWREIFVIYGALIAALIWNWW